MSVLTFKDNGKIINIDFSGQPLLRDLLEREGVALFSPCGGKGTCGKCAVKLSGNASEPNAKEVAFGCRLACQTVLLGDAQCELINKPEDFSYIQADSLNVNPSDIKNSFSVAMDLGTTTVALKLFDKAGKCLGVESAMNPQRSVSADVMGRIDYALQANAEHLQRQITHCLKGLIASACRKCGISEEEIGEIIITGNTAMLYLLCGYSPKSIACAPFEADELFGKYISEPMKAYLPSCINAFVGADTVCAVMASGMCEKKDTALLCDIGTNGEIALWKNGRLYVTSTAAGPAFEGAEISCGCGAIEGAVNRVELAREGISAHTIGNKAAVGICGSGLLDAVALFLRLGYIDSDGNTASGLSITANGGTVTLVQEDIRALQLAKSAIRSGIEVLLSRTDTDMGEIKAFYLAGGFGNNLSASSAAEIGLIPKSLEDKVIPIGNAALNGASMLLFNKKLMKKAEAMAEDAVHIQLGGEADFNEAFIKNMGF